MGFLKKILNIKKTSIHILTIKKTYFKKKRRETKIKKKKILR
jgi:hypothetical protein